MVVEPFIRLGVWLRQSMTLLRVWLKRMLGRSKAPNLPWSIVSNHPEQVAKQLGLEHWNQGIPATGHANVVIDDADCTCSQIVELIERNSRKGLLFHTFASRGGYLITPKMK